MVRRFLRVPPGRKPGAGDRDPWWDFFINRTPADPNNDLTRTIAGAPAGTVYPVKTDLPEPTALSQQLKELAIWLGADKVGVAKLESSYLVVERSTIEDEQVSGSPADLLERYPYAIVFALYARYDPERAQGMGGQLAVQNGAIVSFNIAAYIRELGYLATIGGAEPLRVAQGAGLVQPDRHGKPAIPGHRGFVHLAGPVLTNLPVMPDGPPT